MKLSNLISSDENFGIKDILKDVEFQSLALSNTDLDFDFCTFIDNEKYITALAENAKMVITTAEISKLIDRGVCISDNPRITFFKLHNYLAETENYSLEKAFETQVGCNSKISNLAYIADKNVKIGHNVMIEEFVSIKENTIIGDNTIIRAGSIIGGEGFEFKKMPDGHMLPVKHMGWVLIGSNVELQQQVCVDKAIYPWDKTIIADNCKLDNLIHIAHGVKLHPGVFVAAGAVTGGRTVIKENTWIGVGATVSNGLVIGKNAKVNIGAVATRDVAENGSVTGNFAVDHKRFIEFIKTIR